MTTSDDDLDVANRMTTRLIAGRRAWRLDRHRDPLDLAGHRARVIDDVGEGRRPTAPVFAYRPPEERVVDETAALADDLDNLAGPLVGLVATAARMDAEQADLHVHRDSDTVTTFGRRWFGLPDGDLVADARTTLTAEPHADDAVGTVDAHTAAERVRGVLSDLDLQGWTVEVDAGMAARMSVSALRRLVKVRADATFSEMAMRGLIVHEIGTHVLRAANGARQRLTLLAVGTPGYLETEEGLATWHEGLVSSNAARTRTFALRVIANQVALSSGFADVLAALLDHGAPVQLAFDITARAKRGMQDTAAPGASLKDIVYLRGLRRVGEVAGDDDTHDLLMRGKAGIDDLPLLRRLRSEGRMSPQTFDVHDLVGGR